MGRSVDRNHQARRIPSEKTTTTIEVVMSMFDEGPMRPFTGITIMLALVAAWWLLVGVAIYDSIKRRGRGDKIL